MAKRSGWVTGTVIVLIGILLLLNTTGTYKIGSIWTYIPSLFVLLGLYSLIKSRFRDLFGPLVLIFVGGVWQLVSLGELEGSEAWDLWPAILIILGISILFNRRRRFVSEWEGDEFEVVSVSGRSNRNIEPSKFTKGSATAVLGDVNVDLRGSEISSPSELEAVSVLGDLKIRVPEEWNVRIEGTSFLGSIKDKRPEMDRGSEPDLVIDGVAVLGDITIS